ncbi:HK97 gp10 family phage protein [Neopusillimonas aromaticivorans]|nr:HK97 gp10 family phage protein [Neopusillimonas aromaticivorans]WJJ93443.1 HK97 gp10 family phage protein [Neopusillimonas aromaticivorans]
MKITMDVKGLNGALETLRALPAEIVSKRGGPVKLALAKAARVIRDQAKANVRAIVAEPNKDGRPTKSTGALEKSIIVTRGKMRGGVKGEKYLVRIPKGDTFRYANTRYNRRKKKSGRNTPWKRLPTMGVYWNTAQARCDHTRGCAQQLPRKAKRQSTCSLLI